MSKLRITYKTRNVNSKRLLNDFTNFIDDVSSDHIVIQSSFLDHTYTYDELVQIIEMYLIDLAEKNVITQYDMVADHRVNDAVAIAKGNINILVHFRQTNCLNVTEILTTFKNVT